MEPEEPKEPEDRYHELLVDDILNLIMNHLIQDAPIEALMLACTCKQERERYGLLCENKLIYRELVLQFTDEQGYWAKGGNWVLPGEKGFEYWRERSNQRITKISRNEFIRPMQLAKKSRQRREKNLDKQRWRKHDYD